MPELLLELFSEEIPARMQGRAAEQLKQIAADRLEKAELAFETAAAFATPRRLTLVVEGLPERQADVTEERKGPRLDAPEQALEGFMKSAGLTSLEEAEVRETPRGKFYFVSRRKPGRPSREVLPEIVLDCLQSLSWPKAMRWCDTTFRWVRPLHSILAVFDGAPLSGRLDLGGGKGIDFGATTSGHRFLAPGRFEVTGFEDYRDRLLESRVVLDPAERRRAIHEQCERLAEAEKLTLQRDDGLLGEVVGLVEWPKVYMGTIDKAFMELPPEVLSTSMRTHQKYFSTRDSSGRLANRFLFIANADPRDEGAAIVAGNERVLRARLADAQFFWDQDRKKALSARARELSEIVFHARLGTLDQKADRLELLAAEIAAYVPGADRDKARSAARLAKADLTTGMVGEFPELQGIMGRYYALHDGEHEDVADAIAEHYSPLGPGDSCPHKATSVTLSLADKLDTLAGFFAIGETPTGSKDPYALRRAALGVIRLIVENRLRISLSTVLRVAIDSYGYGIFAGREGENHVALKAAGGGAAPRGVRPLAHPSPTEAALSLLLDFFAERLKVALKDKGVRHDLIAAVFAVSGEDDFVRLLARVEALEGFLKSDDGAVLLTAYRRATNIVRIEERKEKRTIDPDWLKPDLLREPQELALHDALEAANGKAREAILAEDFEAAMHSLAALRLPIDTFFDNVTVNVDEASLRENRLALLTRIGRTVEQVADFSKIEGE